MVQDFSETDTYARQLREEMEKSSTTSGVTISRKDYVPEIRFVFDRQKLAENGLNLATASLLPALCCQWDHRPRTSVRMGMSMISVSASLWARQSLQDLSNLLVYTPQGKTLRLSDLGHIDEAFTPPTIERKDRSRVITLSLTPTPGVQLSELVGKLNEVLAAHPVPRAM